MSVLRSGHPLHVFGTTRTSDHPRGRAVDVWALDHRPLVVPANHALAASGMALEVNSSGLRHTIGETYPAAWAVRRFRELGGDRVTTGSDAHLPDSFAFGLEEAYEIVAAAGFSKLSLQRALDRGDLQLPERFRQ